jgi:Polyketide cyclase / dehydrase and lipid transport
MNATIRHQEAAGLVAASPDAVFAHLDDQTRLAAHMSRRSWMMGGGRMTYEFDQEHGQAVGSHIRMGGSAFGIGLALDEVVTERNPPTRKAWRTVGKTRLIVVGGYTMGFDLAPANPGTRVEVWIDYALPRTGIGRWFPSLSDAYARWCVQQMVRDTVAAFASTPSATRNHDQG